MSDPSVLPAISHIPLLLGHLKLIILQWIPESNVLHYSLAEALASVIIETQSYTVSVGGGLFEKM